MSRPVWQLTTVWILSTRENRCAVYARLVGRLCSSCQQHATPPPPLNVVCTAACCIPRIVHIASRLTPSSAVSAGTAAVRLGNVLVVSIDDTHMLNCPCWLGLPGNAFEVTARTLPIVYGVDVGADACSWTVSVPFSLQFTDSGCYA